MLHGEFDLSIPLYLAATVVLQHPPIAGALSLLRIVLDQYRHDLGLPEFPATNRSSHEEPADQQFVTDPITTWLIALHCDLNEVIDVRASEPEAPLRLGNPSLQHPPSVCGQTRG